MLIELTVEEKRKALIAIINNANESKKYMIFAERQNNKEGVKVFKNERFECIKLANKINNFLLQYNLGGYISIYKECCLSGVELKNYLSWLEKQEA